MSELYRVKSQEITLFEANYGKSSIFISKFVYSTNETTHRYNCREIHQQDRGKSDGFLCIFYFLVTFVSSFPLLSFYKQNIINNKQIKKDRPTIYRLDKLVSRLHLARNLLKQICIFRSNQGSQNLNNLKLREVDSLLFILLKLDVLELYISLHSFSRQCAFLSHIKCTLYIPMSVLSDIK